MIMKGVITILKAKSCRQDGTQRQPAPLTATERSTMEIIQPAWCFRQESILLDGYLI